VNASAKLTSDDVTAIADSHGKRSIEGSAIGHFDFGTRYEAELCEIAERIRVRIAHAPQDGGAAFVEIGEFGELGFEEFAVCSGNRIAVRILGGFTEQAGHAIDELIGGGMLESFGLIVYAVPGVPEDTHEKQLDYAVPANELHGMLDAFVGEARTMVADVFNEPLIGKTFEHAGDGTGGHTQAFRNCGSADWLARAGKLVERLQVIFDSRRRHLVGSSPIAALS
jgi:hypothetical protein